MKIIYDKPRTGKTTELIRRCAEKGGYIVCQDSKQCDDIISMAEEMKCNIPYPMTFSEFVNGKYYAKGVKRVYIDNADMLIKSIAKGVEVDSIVMDDLKERHSDGDNQKLVFKMILSFALAFLFVAVTFMFFQCMK